MVWTSEIKLDLAYQTFGTTILDEKCARFLGWMTGDGGVSGGNPYLTAAPDELEMVTKIFYDFLGRLPGENHEAERTSYIMWLTKEESKDIASLYGERCSALDKFIPELIFKSPKSVVAAFLSALFSADGSCCPINRSCNLVSTSTRTIRTSTILNESTLWVTVRHNNP